jgi:hypothetical protein
MYWKVLFWLSMALLVVALFGSAMAVAGGGVKCTFDTGIWAACLKFASGMLLLRIGVPILLLAGLIRLVKER